MRHIHRVMLSHDDRRLRQLHFLGVDVGAATEGTGTRLYVFELDEDHPNWGVVSNLLARWDVFTTTRTVFSRSEAQDAPWLRIAAWPHGYPQPNENNNGYLAATYDLTAFCETCRIGKVQTAPFQMKKEPKWGRRSMLMLTWIYDEIFVTPALWADVFDGADIGFRPVLDTKKRELKTVVQLDIKDSVGLILDDALHERCARCDRVKFAHRQRGRAPAPRSNPSAAMVRSCEYFGSGGQADRLILVSQPLASALAQRSVRGHELIPAENTPVGSSQNLM